MEKLKQAAKSHWFKLLLSAFGAVCLLLYTQQNEIIAGQGKKMVVACAEINQTLKEKVNNETLEKMIEIINLKLDYDSEKWRDQKEFNKEASETMRSLNKSIIILNEKMKVK